MKRATLMRAITIGWSSFLAAAVAFVVFFATFDPALLAEAATFPMQLDRIDGYTLGFIALWVLTAASSALAVFLLTPPDSNRHSSSAGQ